MDNASVHNDNMTSNIDKIPQSRTIDVLLFNGVNILDVAGPVQAFETARFNNRKVYSHRYLSLDGKPVRASFGLSLCADGRLSSRSRTADLLILVAMWISFFIITSYWILLQGKRNAWVMVGYIGFAPCSDPGCCRHIERTACNDALVEGKSDLPIF